MIMFLWSKKTNIKHSDVSFTSHAGPSCFFFFFFFNDLLLLLLPLLLADYNYAHSSGIRDLCVVDCLLSLRDHMSSGIGEDVLYDATKYRSQPRKKWNISGGDNMISMDVSQGNHKGSEPSSPLSARSSSEPKSQNVLRNPFVPGMFVMPIL